VRINNLNDTIPAIKPKKFEERKKRLDKQNVATKVKFFFAINQEFVNLTPESAFID